MKLVNIKYAITRTMTTLFHFDHQSQREGGTGGWNTIPGAPTLLTKVVAASQPKT